MRACATVAAAVVLLGGTTTATAAAETGADVSTSSVNGIEVVHKKVKHTPGFLDEGAPGAGTCEPGTHGRGCGGRHAPTNGAEREDEVRRDEGADRRLRRRDGEGRSVDDRHTAKRWRHAGEIPAITTGMLTYFTPDDEKFGYCSAAVITADNNSTLWTATLDWFVPGRDRPLVGQLRTVRGELRHDKGSVRRTVAPRSDDRQAVHHRQQQPEEGRRQVVLADPRGRGDRRL